MIHDRAEIGEDSYSHERGNMFRPPFRLQTLFLSIMLGAAVCLIMANGLTSPDAYSPSRLVTIVMVAISAGTIHRLIFPRPILVRTRFGLQALLWLMLLAAAACLLTKFVASSEDHSLADYVRGAIALLLTGLAIDRLAFSGPQSK